MFNKENLTKSIISFIFTTFTWLFGTWDSTLMILICFMVLDYCTGMIKAYIYKELSSDRGLKGIARKAVILVVLIVSVLLDRLINNENFIFRTLICYFYIANEGLSILENCCKIGIPVPKNLKEALIQLTDCSKKNKD